VKIAVFLSRPTPYLESQSRFIDGVCSYLDEHGYAPRTLGVTDYDLDVPLKAIRRLMLECNGLITLALARTYVAKGAANYQTDLGSVSERSIDGVYLTTPWSHIEAAMAYQLGLPVLVIREAKVLADGLLEKGVLGTYMPEVDLDKPPAEYFESQQWLQTISKWEGYVRAVVDNKGNPPRLY
jgi:hypothetical protein